MAHIYYINMIFKRITNAFIEKFFRFKIMIIYLESVKLVNKIAKFCVVPLDF